MRSASRRTATRELGGRHVVDVGREVVVGHGVGVAARGLDGAVELAHGVVLRLREHQVLEQVGEAGLARGLVLVARADAEPGHVADAGRGRVGREHDRRGRWQAPLADAERPERRARDLDGRPPAPPPRARRRRAGAARRAPPRRRRDRARAAGALRGRARESHDRHHDRGSRRRASKFRRHREAEILHDARVGAGGRRAAWPGVARHARVEVVVARRRTQAVAVAGSNAEGLAVTSPMYVKP